MPPQFSSSPYYLVVVEPDPATTFPPPAAIFTPAPPSVTPTVTPTPRPTATTTATPTRTPTSTPSVKLAVSELPAAGKGIWLPTVPPHFYLGLALLATATILAVVIVRRPRLAGLLEISKDGQSYKTIDLSAYGRQVTIGANGRIKLEDDDEASPTIPPIAARLVAERGPEGSGQVIWQPVADATDDETASYRLKHGDREIIGPYQFVYQNFSETETVNELFEGGIWNEV